MGQRPLRAIVEAAFGLPASLGNLDVDRQKTILEEKSSAIFGSKSPTVFLDDGNIEQALRRYFALQAAQNGPQSSTRGSAALTLLSAGPSSASSQIGLILSNALRP
jgi:hypothetical protein